MTILNILHYPHEHLQKRLEPVAKVDVAVSTLVDDMFETMYQGNGVGLAATQVGSDVRVFVMDMGRPKSEPLCFINPEIFEESGHQIHQEGCLSFPGIYVKVERANKILVRALDQQGNPFEREFDDYPAVCIQHELDHLNGIVFVDHLSKFKRDRALNKYYKLNKITY